jgi:predicted nucleic acid-binding protein
MGLEPKRVYFDSCIVIYAVEEHPAFGSLIEARLASEANDGLIIQVSDLTEIECLVMPLRKANQALLEKFRQWFEKVAVLSIERKVFREAAQLRANFAGLKTPDAIHLAMALHHKVDAIWTNDDRLSSIAPGLVKDITTA